LHILQRTDRNCHDICTYWFRHSDVYREDIETHRQDGDGISLILFFTISGLKIGQEKGNRKIVEEKEEEKME
jgi:hypothetical protein